MAGKRTVTVDVAGYDKQHGPHSQFECIAESGGENTNLDCDEPFPNNEPDIEVDPVDPDHMVASSNDYGSCCDQFYTSKDGGATWTTGNMSRKTPQVNGSDPVTVFDSKHGTVIHTSLNYSLQLPTGEACRGDVVASVSTDGGITWLPPVVVDSGFGCDLSVSQTFNDKEWVVTDNSPSSQFYGRTYLTWTKFVSASGAYVSSASSSRTPTTAASTGRRRMRSPARTPRSAPTKKAGRPASATRTSSRSRRWDPTAPSTSLSRTNRTSPSGSWTSTSTTSTS